MKHPRIEYIQHLAILTAVLINSLFFFNEICFKKNEEKDKIILKIQINRKFKTHPISIGSFMKYKNKSSKF